MELIKKKLKDLKPAEYNPRKKLKPEDKEYQKIKKSLEEFGYADPIIINKDNTIIGGHQRANVMLELGYDEVEVVQLDLDKNKEKALNIALNKITGEWDYAMLGDLLLDLDANNYDLEMTGFDLDEIENLLAPIGEPEEVVEDDFDCTPPEEPKAKLGDIYQLGNHRLMCGDSTKEEDIAKLINGDKIDMLYTDPPYGMNLNTDFSGMKNNLDFAKEKSFVGGKKYEQGIVDDFNPKMISVILKLNIKETFLWGADYFAELLPNKNDGSWIVWDKRANGNDNIEEDYSSDKMYGSCFELCWSKNKHKRNIARIKWAGVFGTEQEFDHKRYHPTQKPIKLSQWFLEKYSNGNDNILDLFGGSGSTLIACEQLNRNCYMMELDPKYVDVIINRWETFTGKKAIKIEGEE